MKFEVITGGTLPEAYHSALIAMHTLGVQYPCPDYNTTMKEIPAIINVLAPLREPRISRMVICGAHELQQYEMEIIDGILDKRVGHGWDYTYHNRFVEQIPELVNEFKRNIYTRRAVLQIRDWKVDLFSTDPACLQLINFSIREGKLNCTVYFRSNDLYNATFMNMWALIRLQEHICYLLQLEGIEVEMGSYSHVANSLHIYEKDFERFEHNIKELDRRLEAGEPLTYDFKNYFEDMMLAEIPSIQELVETLTSGM